MIDIEKALGRVVMGGVIAYVVGVALLALSGWVYTLFH